MINLFNELIAMQTHQYLSSSSANNDSRPSSFHQEALIANGTGVVYRVAHMNGGVGNGGAGSCNGVGPARPISRQSTYHNRLSYRAFGSPPSSSTHGTSHSNAAGQPAVTNNGAMTTSWPNNNGTLTNSGWINLALDSDPYQQYHPNGSVVGDMTVEKSFSHNKPVQNGGGTINRVPSYSIKDSNGVLHQNGGSTPATKQINGVGPTKTTLQPKVTISNHHIYAALLSLFVIGFPACIMSILSFQLLTTLSYSFSSSDNSLTIMPSKTNEILRDLAVGLCTTSLATSVTSILSSFLQCYLCLKILKSSPDSKIRIVLYLRSNIYLRLFIDGGFFIGIICFLLSIIIYVHLFSNASSAAPSVTSTIVTVIVGVGIIFCLLIMIHGAYSWLCGRLNVQDDEKDSTNLNNEKKNKKQINFSSSDTNKNLSTLV